jgi:hypothetical protein
VLANLKLVGSSFLLILGLVRSEKSDSTGSMQSMIFQMPHCLSNEDQWSVNLAGKQKFHSHKNQGQSGGRDERQLTGAKGGGEVQNTGCTDQWQKCLNVLSRRTVKDRKNQRRSWP